MKKLLLLALIILPSLATCSESPFYIGSELGYSISGFKDRDADKLSRAKHNRPDATVFTGADLTDYLSFELGYSPSISNRAKTREKRGATSHKGLYGSILYHIALSDVLTLTPGIGIAGSNIYFHKPGEFAFAKSKSFPRVSLGINYALTDDISLRSTLAWNYVRTHFGTFKTHDNYKVGIGFTYRLNMI